MSSPSPSPSTRFALISIEDGGEDMTPTTRSQTMARQRAGRGSTSDAGRQTNRADILDRLSIIEPSGLLPHEILRTDFDQVHGPSKLFYEFCGVIQERSQQDSLLYSRLCQTINSGTVLSISISKLRARLQDTFSKFRLFRTGRVTDDDVQYNVRQCAATLRQLIKSTLAFFNDRPDRQKTELSILRAETINVICEIIDAVCQHRGNASVNRTTLSYIDPPEARDLYRFLIQGVEEPDFALDALDDIAEFGFFDTTKLQDTIVNLENQCAPDTYIERLSAIVELSESLE